MAASVVKKVRLDRARLRRLARLARALGKTESDVLRDGLDLLAMRERRREGAEKLIALLGDQPEPPKIRFRLR